MDAQLANLEVVRADLEANVTKLEGLLRHWRVWEAEYEGFREALSNLKEHADSVELSTAAEDSRGELLVEKEIKSLIEDKGHFRTPKQILGLLSRRIDYVQENIKAAERRLAAEQKKLDKANFADHRDDGGLPLTEITEELDEEATSVSKPGDAAPKILDAMRQSGLTDEAKPDTKSSSSTNASSALPNAVTGGSDADDTSPEDTSSEHAAARDESPEDAALRQEMLRYSMEEAGSVVAEINLEDNDDTDRQLDYEATDDGEDYEDDEDTDDSDIEAEDTEEEDEFGRTTRRVVSDEYRQKMLELERKLGVRSMINAGPETASTDPVKNEMEEGRVDHEAEQGKKPRSGVQKGVRFAETLDIQEAPTNPAPVPASQEALIETRERPVATDVVEREATPKPPSLNVAAPKKISKFKASRAAQQAQDPISGFTNDISLVANGPLARNGLSDRLVPATHSASTKFMSILSEPVMPREVPGGPRGKTHVETVVERPMSDKKTMAKAPDELDPELMNQQIRDEYNRAHNRRIQKKDGFMSIDQEDLEDEEGRPKISRFKAARLARS